MNSQKNGLGEGLGIIPTTAWAIVGALFILWITVGLPMLFRFMIHGGKPAFGGSLFALTGITIGVVALLALALLVVYVNIDSGRRRMNRVLWTLLVIFIPNAIGFILYFLLRKPLAEPCPQCQSVAQSDYVVCPVCGHVLKAQCAVCHRTVEPGWVKCAYCAASLSDAPSPRAHEA